MRRIAALALLLFTTVFSAHAEDDSDGDRRLSMFVGIDVSQSFYKGQTFQEALDFLSQYLYIHLKGLGGAERPKALFVGPIGGNMRSEAKTLFPIQQFENKTVHEIRQTLVEALPKKPNRYTDFNSFFRIVGDIIRDRKLILRPTSIVLISDGKPSGGLGPNGISLRNIKVAPLESLSRNITVRLLYPESTVSAAWRDRVKRKRVKIWTQDLLVMRGWNDPKIFDPHASIETQPRFLEWVRENVDFDPRGKRVD